MIILRWIRGFGLIQHSSICVHVRGLLVKLGFQYSLNAIYCFSTNQKHTWEELAKFIFTIFLRVDFTQHKNTIVIRYQCRTSTQELVIKHITWLVFFKRNN